jgi:hypothetical protein
MRLLVTVAVAAIVLLPLHDAAASTGDGVLWGGSTHTAKDELSAWLTQRGASYATWAERHPGAAGRLEGLRVAPPPGTASPAVEGPQLAVTDPDDTSRFALLALVVAVALLAVAALPRALVPGRLVAADGTWRLVVVACGMAVFVGWAVPLLAGG